MIEQLVEKVIKENKEFTLKVKDKIIQENIIQKYNRLINVEKVNIDGNIGLFISPLKEKSEEIEIIIQEDLNQYLHLSQKELVKIGMIKNEDGTQVYKLKDLNEPLIFYRTLDLTDCNLKEIPNIVVHSVLYLSYNKITKIPENFKQTGHLYLSNNKIKSISENFTQNGYLNLCNNQIKQLPENFIQNGYLDLSYNKITHLPENFIQRGELILRNNQIEHLPDNFTHTRHLELFGNPIKKFLKTFKKNPKQYLDI